METESLQVLQNASSAEAAAVSGSMETPAYYPGQYTPLANPVTTPFKPSESAPRPLGPVRVRSAPGTVIQL